jgi:hypothetical protein
VAEIDELALHAPMAPRWVARCDADHELADRGCRGRPSGTPPVRVVPFAVTSRRFQASRVAGVTANTLVPPAPGDRPGDCGEPQPVGRLVADPAGVAAQYSVLVPEHQQFGSFGRLTLGSTIRQLSRQRTSR